MKNMPYQKVLKMFENILYLSVGLDVGADFTWMSIILPNGTLTGKPFKIVHSDLQSRELAVTKIKEAQEAYSLKSRCFLESTGIYHIPLLCFLRDKGFDCSVINPIITKNSTNMNVRKLHNDKFDSKKAAKVGLDASLKTSIIPVPIGKPLMLSPAFPPASTGHATFTASGAPSSIVSAVIHTHSFTLAKSVCYDLH